ncbi:MAG: hypothetical protein LBP95_07275, partial [Deltaproteobacteria bacterium]|nr:hypothetical protein [Deltaproteobacteria bacterium]
MFKRGFVARREIGGDDQAASLVFRAVPPSLVGAALRARVVIAVIVVVFLFSPPRPPSFLFPASFL